MTGASSPRATSRSAAPRRAVLAALAALALLAGMPLHAAGLWLDEALRPNGNAADALHALAAAADDGLQPADYGASGLAALAQALHAGATPAQAAAFERELEAATARLLRHLQRGRVDPAALGFRVARPPPRDPTALLRAAAAARQVPELVAGLRPRLAQYARLREALAHYRGLAAREPAPPPRPARALHPGDAYAHAAALHGRLVALGDLPLGSVAPARYEGELVEGLRRFQRRHGLADDGVIGPATAAALAVPMAQRVQQLEWALERLRWLPELPAQPMLLINIPMFRLWARDPSGPQATPLAMDVVVGKALDTRTPVLAAEMRHLVFRPYWNVPRSILRDEVLPAVERDPAWLQRHGMEIVRGGGDDAAPLPATAEHLALLREGRLRLRQRPGAANSLGLVKFIFPNLDNVYLHGTPERALFARARRDFSHGCVRVQDPLALAQWLLRDQPRWTPERIAAAMAGPAVSQHVPLARPLPVLLFYVTAMVWPDDGTLHFAPDIYGHDARLAQALTRR